MKKLHQWVGRFAFAALLGVSAATQVQAAFVTSGSSFGSNTLILDTQTGIEWLRLDATLGLSYEAVTSQMDGGELFSGFSVASFDQVSTLFMDAGVWAPFAPMTSPSGQAAGASFADYFGGHVNANGVVVEGMTSESMGPFGYLHLSLGVSYRTGVSTSSWHDAYHSGASALVGTWLTKSAVAVAPIPEPATYVLMLGGLLAGGGVLRRRR